MCTGRLYFRATANRAKSPDRAVHHIQHSTSEDMGKLFDLEASGYFYPGFRTRRMTLLQPRSQADMEGGAAAMLTLSGQAANFLAMFNICECGDHIVAFFSIYGGNLQSDRCHTGKMGITGLAFVSPGCHGRRIKRSLPSKHKLIQETIANPALTVLDIELFALRLTLMAFRLWSIIPSPHRSTAARLNAISSPTHLTKYMDLPRRTPHSAGRLWTATLDWMAHADNIRLCTPMKATTASPTQIPGKEAFITKMHLPADARPWLYAVTAECLHSESRPESLSCAHAKASVNGQQLRNFWSRASGRQPTSIIPDFRPANIRKEQKYPPNGGCGVVSWPEGSDEVASHLYAELCFGAPKLT